MKSVCPTTACEAAYALQSLLRELRKLDRGPGEANQRLQHLRDEVARELAQADGPEQAAVLMDLQEQVDWCLASGLNNTEKQAAAEAIREARKDVEQLVPNQAIAKAAHLWENAWNWARGAANEAVQLALQDAASRLQRLGDGDAFPGSKVIENAVNGMLPMSGLLQEMEQFAPLWDECYTQAINRLAQQGYARHGGPIKTAIEYVLIVEDHDDWRKDVEIEVQKLLADLGLSRLKIVAVSNCDDARTVAQGAQGKGILAICDLGLPQSQDEHVRQQFDPDNGLQLICDLKALGARVVALTTQDSMAGAFINLSLPIDDFILKASEGWEKDLAARLRAWLRPIDPGTLPLLVPTFDRRIRLGPVWIELSSMQFEIVHALACAAIGRISMTPQSFVQPLEADDSARPARDYIPVESLQEIMCRADLTGLPETFMVTDRFEINVSTHVRAIGDVITAGFEAVHLSVAGHEFIEREQNQRSYRLNCSEITVVDSPVEYRKRTAGIARPYKSLVIEDDPGWAQDIHSALQYSLPKDSVIELAFSYEEAIEKSEKLRPILVTLDLSLPKEGKLSKETGLALRRQLMQRFHGIGIVVLTSHDDLLLQRELSRSLVTEDPRTRLRESDLLLKSDSEWLPKLRIRILRLLKEREAVLPEQPKAAHRVKVDPKNPQNLLEVDGTAVKMPDRGNADMDLALLTLLASYDNQPLRRLAILDYWHEKGLTRGVNDPSQRLNDRVNFLREKITQFTGVPGEEIIASYDDAYLLQGFVELVGLP